MPRRRGTNEDGTVLLCPRKRPRDTESLSLAAAELMRIPIDVFRAQADFLQLSESESIIASQNDGIE